MSLIQFPNRSDGLPPARAKLVGLNAEISGLEARVGVLAGMRQKLEAEFSKVGEAELARDDLIHRAARSLVDRITGGGELGFETLSRKAAIEDEKISASHVKARIIEKAISEIDDELEQLSAKHAECEASKGALILEVVNEATAGLRADRAQSLETLREGLVRCAAVDRLLASPRHDWAPPGRLAVLIPNSLFADLPAEEVLLAPNHEIDAAQGVLSQFMADLESDPLAVLGEFPPVTGIEGPDLEYAKRSAPERARITAATVHSNRQRPAPPEPSFAAQAIDFAKSAIGL